MNRLTVCVAALALGSTACELIVNVDGVARPDGGAGGGTSTGGSGGGTNTGGGGGTGTGGTGGTGGGSTDVGYDGGPPCSGSMLPKLRCDAPMTLATGGTFSTGAMATTDGGILAAWINGNSVELDFVVPGGSHTAMVNATEGVPPTLVRVSAEGNNWAFAYTTSDQSTNAPIKCFSAAAPTTSVTVGDDIAPSDFGLAVDATGGVAVVRGGDPFGWAVGAAGCPTTLATVASMNYDYVNAVHIPGGGVGNYRFPLIGPGINGGHWELALIAPLAAGGLSSRVSEGQVAFVFEDSELEVALSSDGQTVNATWVPVIDDNTGATNLGVFGMPTDLTQSGGTLVTVFPTDIWSWSNSSCGPGCLANDFTAYSGSTVSVVFTSDDGATQLLTSSTAGWDVTCSVPQTSTGVTSAYQGGRLHFLVTAPSSVKLYSCDVPPH